MDPSKHMRIRERFEREEKKDALGFHREDYIKWLEEHIAPYFDTEDSEWRTSYCDDCPLRNKLLPCHPPDCQKYERSLDEKRT